MTFFPRIKGPVAPYSNVPIEPQNFQPSQFVITALTFGLTTIVTMANGTNNVAPNYVIGQEVRITIPPKFGARQLNGQTGIVIGIPAANQVTVNINSLGTDTFIASPVFVTGQSQTPPQIVSIGDTNSGQINSSGLVSQGTVIPGSFENISA